MKIMVLCTSVEKVVALSLLSFLSFYLFILVGSLAYFFMGFFGLFYFLTWDNAPIMMIITLSTQNLEQL
ncbi:hypothetical protein D9K95_16700 [Klebsiella pneumoniae]|nr:hypothetical protein D9K95_16700 [Klebsiella pneumoniae]